MVNLAVDVSVGRGRGWVQQSSLVLEGNGAGPTVWVWPWRWAQQYGSGLGGEEGKIDVVGDVSVGRGRGWVQHSLA